MFEHIHHDQCESTQNELITKLTDDRHHKKHMLISCDSQLNGYGRNSQSWVFTPGSLAFSFSFSPPQTLSLAPLEVAVSLIEYFQRQHQVSLKLKWPNDLIIQNNLKCGGILIDAINNQLCAAGVGVNIGMSPKLNDSDYQAGHLVTSEEMTTKQITHQFYHFFLNHRTSDNLIIHKWMQSCIHIDQMVQIHHKEAINDGIKRELEGIFIGVDQYGRALIKDSKEKVHAISSGSLKLIYS